MACIGEKRNACRVLKRKGEVKKYLQHLGVNGKIILKLILIMIGGFVLDSLSEGCGKLACCCVCGNEHSRLMMIGEYSNRLRTC
jgi:hypothetical protein